MSGVGEDAGSLRVGGGSPGGYAGASGHCGGPLPPGQGPVETQGRL